MNNGINQKIILRSSSHQACSVLQPNSKKQITWNRPLFFRERLGFLKAAQKVNLFAHSKVISFFFSSSSNLGLMPGIIWTMLLSVVQITGHSFIFWQLDCIARKKMSQKRNDWQRRFDRKKWCRLIYLRFIKMWRYVIKVTDRTGIL